MFISKFGVLYLVASCVLDCFEDNLSIFVGSSSEDKKKGDFVYEHSQNLLGFYGFGNVQVMMIPCRSKTEQSQLTKLNLVTMIQKTMKKQFRETKINS